MGNSTLSVVTCNYNHGQYIGRAIDAVVSQSRPPDEYIILDDGSTDNSADIIASYAQRYSYIRFVGNERNTGAVAAMRHAIDLATGDYLYGGAADDFVLPRFFERAMDMAERHPRAGIIFGKLAVIDPDGNELTTAEVRRWQDAMFISPSLLLKDYLEIESPNHSLCGATVYRRECLIEVGGFRSELGSWCDTFAARAIALKYGACYIPEVLMCWRHMPNSLSQTTARNTRCGLDIVARAVWLMRSQQFRDRFPKTHVDRWEKEYRKLVIAIRPSSCYGSVQAWCGRYLPGLARHAIVRHFVIPLADRFLRMVSRALTIREELAWRRYDGDVSCYAEENE